MQRVPEAMAMLSRWLSTREQGGRWALWRMSKVVSRVMGLLLCSPLHARLTAMSLRNKTWET